jgi:hypothetical protein
MLISCLLIQGCNSSNEKDAAKYSDSLIVVAGAKDLHYTKLEGTDQILYIVEAEYPANSVLQEIFQKLEAKGWRPFQEDYLNPGLPSSHVRGWTDFIDATKKQRKKVYQWLAQWENKNHDILWCTLRYSYPDVGKPNLSDLTVSKVFIPSKIAIEARK